MKEVWTNLDDNLLFIHIVFNCWPVSEDVSTGLGRRASHIRSYEAHTAKA